jgi:hypothetical protein
MHFRPSKINRLRVPSTAFTSMLIVSLISGGPVGTGMKLESIFLQKKNKISKSKIKMLKIFLDELTESDVEKHERRRAYNLPRRGEGRERMKKFLHNERAHGKEDLC